MHLKKYIKIGEFLYSHFNIEDGRKYAIFLVYMLYYFKNGKNASETQEDLYSVWRRCCDLYVVCKVSWYYLHFGQIILCCGAVLYIGRCLAAPLPSTH